MARLDPSNSSWIVKDPGLMMVEMMLRRERKNGFLGKKMEDVSRRELWTDSRQAGVWIVKEQV